MRKMSFFAAASHELKGLEATLLTPPLLGVLRVVSLLDAVAVCYCTCVCYFEFGKSLMGKKSVTSFLEKD